MSNESQNENQGAGIPVVPPAENLPDLENAPFCPIRMLSGTIHQAWPQPQMASPYAGRCIGEKCAWCVVDVGPNGHRYPSCAIKHITEHNSAIK